MMRPLLAGCLVLAALGPSVVFAKGMNPIRAPHHLQCPPGFTPAGGRCIKRFTIIKGRAYR